jgi:hypothetical protein
VVQKKYHKVALSDATVFLPCKGQDKLRKRIKEWPVSGPHVMRRVKRVSAPRWVIQRSVGSGGIFVTYVLTRDLLVLKAPCFTA